MPSTSPRPREAEIKDGTAVFRDNMPIWHARFGDDVWPFDKPDSPFYRGMATSSIVWRDFVEGRGATYGHYNSVYRSTYSLCLAPEMVQDLKITAVIYGYLPGLIKHSHKKHPLAPITVKARIDDLAKIFSLAIVRAKEKFNQDIRRLCEIPFSLLKEVIPKYPGRSSELKRALKLISDPMVQRNLSAPLQWGQPDIEKSNIAWPLVPDAVGIPTLLDSQFTFLMEGCKVAITKFKAAAGLEIRDRECRALEQSSDWYENEMMVCALESYFTSKRCSNEEFLLDFGYSLDDVKDIIEDGHTAALVLVLLLTGMRRSEIQFLRRDCLKYEYGYWFLVSKVVKRRPKNSPIAEGWLAIDLIRDAYDILMFVTERTKVPYLFSSPWRRTKRSLQGYRPATLNEKISRWLEKIDSIGLFEDWTFSVHQLRETLVAQLAKQQVGLPFISMQLKHFHSQFTSMPNAVTAGYGEYRKQLMTSITNRLAIAREESLNDVYGEDARFAGGGAGAHKARIDAFFSGLGLFGEARERYIKDMARRGVKLMPTSIGHCARNFIAATNDAPPPCYGDYQCDPNCESHVITARSAETLLMRREYALMEASQETNTGYKVIWLGLAQELDKHLTALNTGGSHV
ncbi:tyrosine-type recombinase/integrase [Paraburkholderia dipogonis]|uniref:tyrosine-type recombinase/integrase n=1 Tax=Paraburkholderia dipogonis TaxID=1211383 RepID=UPI0038BE0D2C